MEGEGEGEVGLEAITEGNEVEVEDGLEGEGDSEVEEGLKLEVEMEEGLEVEVEEGAGTIVGGDEVEFEVGLEVGVEEGLKVEVEMGRGLEVEVEMERGLEVDVGIERGLEVEVVEGLETIVENDVEAMVFLIHVPISKVTDEKGVPLHLLLPFKYMLEVIVDPEVQFQCSLD